jgi:hypothetical protein
MQMADIDRLGRLGHRVIGAKGDNSEQQASQTSVKQRQEGRSV